MIVANGGRYKEGHARIRLLVVICFPNLWQLGIRRPCNWQTQGRHKGGGGNGVKYPQKLMSGGGGAALQTRSLPTRRSFDCVCRPVFNWPTRTWCPFHLTIDYSNFSSRRWQSDAATRLGFWCPASSPV